MTAFISMTKLNSLPSYKKPPLIEVVCGIVFKRIEQFKAPHLGLFWEKIRDEYPTCEHAPPLGLDAEPWDLANLLPRLWFVNQRDNELIQLQNDRFLYNWRKKHEDDPYPRYGIVAKAFKANLDIFQEFLKEEGLGMLNPTACELTYVNHILKGQGWESLAEINNVLPDLNWRSDNGRFLPEPLSLGWQTTFALPDDKGRLHVNLLQGQIDDRPVLRLDITARWLGVNESLDTIWGWFDVAHEWIVRGFTDLTSREIQSTIWEREDTI